MVAEKALLETFFPNDNFTLLTFTSKKGEWVIADILSTVAHLSGIGEPESLKGLRLDLAATAKAMAGFVPILVVRSTRVCPRNMHAWQFRKRELSYDRSSDMEFYPHFVHTEVQQAILDLTHQFLIKRYGDIDDQHTDEEIAAGRAQYFPARKGEVVTRAYFGAEALPKNPFDA